MQTDFLSWILQLYRTGGVGGGSIAKDAVGNDVVAAEWLKNHGPGDRTLTQGLKVRMSLAKLFGNFGREAGCLAAASSLRIYIYI